MQIYANKFVLYAKFLEAVQSFVRQYNILLLSFVYSDLVFLIGWRVVCFVVDLNLLTWMYTQCLMFNCSTVSKSWSDLGFCHIIILPTLSAILKLRSWPNQSICLSSKLSLLTIIDKTPFLFNQILSILVLHLIYLILVSFIKWI